MSAINLPRPSDFTIPAEPTSADAIDNTENRPVADLLARVPRLDGSDPTFRPGDPGDWLDDTAPGQIGRRQRESRLLERPDWHSVSPPAEVARLWAGLAELAEKADGLRAQWSATKSDEKAERAEVEAEMAAALRSGRPAEDVDTALTDWPRRRLALAAEHRLTVQEMAAARVTYDSAVTRLQVQWRDSLVAAVGAAHQRARNLVGPALAAVSAWQATVQAAHTVAEVLDPELTQPWFDTRTGDAVVAGHQAVEPLAALLASDDPRVTGAYLAIEDDGLRPQLWIRQLMAREGYGGGWRELAFIEREEKFAVTDFTKPGERGAMPTAPFVHEGHVF